MELRKLNQWMASASPWLPICMSFILMAVIFFQTIELFNREKQHVTTLLNEKGTMLIASFEQEIGTGMHGSPAALHRLMEKTASRPDVSYLLLKDGSGTIIARGERNLTSPAIDIQDSPAALPLSGDFNWRIVETKTGTRYFEVFKTARISVSDMSEKPVSSKKPPVQQIPSTAVTITVPSLSWAWTSPV